MTGFGKRKNRESVDLSQCEDESGFCNENHFPANKIVKGVFFCEECSVVIDTETMPLSVRGTCPHCDEDVVIFDPFVTYARMVTKIPD